MIMNVKKSLFTYRVVDLNSGEHQDLNIFQSDVEYSSINLFPVHDSNDLLLINWKRNYGKGSTQLYSLIDSKKIDIRVHQQTVDAKMGGYVYISDAVLFERNRLMFVGDHSDYTRMKEAYFSLFKDLEEDSLIRKPFNEFPVNKRFMRTTRILTHKLVKVGEQYVLVGECFEPQYIDYGSGSTFVGNDFSHLVIYSFDQDGSISISKKVSMNKPAILNKSKDPLFQVPPVGTKEKLVINYRMSELIFSYTFDWQSNETTLDSYSMHFKKGTKFNLHGENFLHFYGNTYYVKRISSRKSGKERYKTLRMRFIYME